MSGQFSFLAVHGAAGVEPNSGASVLPLRGRKELPNGRFNQPPGWIEPAALMRRALTVGNGCGEARDFPSLYQLKQRDGSLPHVLIVFQ